MLPLTLLVAAPDARRGGRDPVEPVDRRLDRRHGRRGRGLPARPAHALPGRWGARCRRSMVAVALVAVGSVAGMSTWVAASSDTDVVLLFALFPSVSCAVGAIVCAGRRDMFLAYAAPLTLWSSFGLWSSGDATLRALAVLSIGYAVAQGFLHHTVSRSLLAALRLQTTTQTLAMRMAADQIALTDAYQQLSVTNGQLAHLASHDPLTGLLNRRGTFESIDALLADDQAAVVPGGAAVLRRRSVQGGERPAGSPRWRPVPVGAGRSHRPHARCRRDRRSHRRRRVRHRAAGARRRSCGRRRQPTGGRARPAGARRGSSDAVVGQRRRGRIAARTVAPAATCCATPTRRCTERRTAAATASRCSTATCSSSSRRCSMPSSRCAGRSTTARSCRSSSPRSTRPPGASWAPRCWRAGCAPTARWRRPPSSSPSPARRTCWSDSPSACWCRHGPTSAGWRRWACPRASASG